MYNLRTVQRVIEGPEPIERTLFLDVAPIAVAFIDPEKPEATLVWPLAQETLLVDVVDSFVSVFLRHQSFQVEELVIEYWLDDQYYMDTLGSDATAVEIISKLYVSAEGSLDLIELLDISAGSTILELVFDYESSNPNRASLLMSAIDARSLGEFFSRFHKSAKVRSDEGIATAALQVMDLEAISSIPVIEEADNVELA